MNKQSKNATKLKRVRFWLLFLNNVLKSKQVQWNNWQYTRGSFGFLIVRIPRQALESMWQMRLSRAPWLSLTRMWAMRICSMSSSCCSAMGCDGTNISTSACVWYPKEESQITSLKNPNINQYWKANQVCQWLSYVFCSYWYLVHVLLCVPSTLVGL